MISVTCRPANNASISAGCTEMKNMRERVAGPRVLGISAHASSANQASLGSPMISASAGRMKNAAAFGKQNTRGNILSVVTAIVIVSAASTHQTLTTVWIRGFEGARRSWGSFPRSEPIFTALSRCHHYSHCHRGTAVCSGANRSGGSVFPPLRGLAPSA